MAIRDQEIPAPAPTRTPTVPNGAAVAAFLAAGIGAFMMGFIVVLSELDIVSIPALYAPAGGVTGRTTAATVIWLVAWAVLHSRWKEREVEPGRVGAAALILTLLGILGTLPPFWALFP